MFWSELFVFFLCLSNKLVKWSKDEKVKEKKKERRKWAWGEINKKEDQGRVYICPSHPWWESVKWVFGVSEFDGDWIERGPALSALHMWYLFIASPPCKIKIRPSWVMEAKKEKEYSKKKQSIKVKRESEREWCAPTYTLSWCANWIQTSIINYYKWSDHSTQSIYVVQLENRKESMGNWARKVGSGSLKWGY